MQLWLNKSRFFHQNHRIRKQIKALLQDSLKIFKSSQFNRRTKKTPTTKKRTPEDTVSKNDSLQSYRKYTRTHQSNVPLHFHELTEVVRLKLQMFDRFSA